MDLYGDNIPGINAVGKEVEDAWYAWAAAHDLPFKTDLVYQGLSD